MTREENQLILKDISARLLYGVKIELTWWVIGEGTCVITTLEPDHIEQLLNDEDGDTEIKPYLRSMSSMTEEERAEYHSYCDHYYDFYFDTVASIDWLNAHHFDYRGLIEKGLAIKVTKENNPYIK